ncbi:hypothetical protein HPB51_027028 [Rhipicephalus microplus]|uniref:Uncharacterized protein n=1 Tax=Rhipicephalus microplus TaxID=6941 RepID=A0A9J6D1A8_RHIMP|nr:hypothetical protein HPB51_027028 [Rhipicephalus microplus]
MVSALLLSEENPRVPDVLLKTTFLTTVKLRHLTVMKYIEEELAKRRGGIQEPELSLHPELLNLDYHSREAQKGDEDLIIGQETRTVVDKLTPSEQQEFFEAVRHYFVTVCDYMRHKFPLADPALLNAEVVQLKTLDTMSLRKVHFFVDSFPAMLPFQPGESKMEAVDALEVEFSKLQAQDLPPHILQEERVDAQ